jgi:trk system potassium uptake protein TrkA
MAATQVLVVGLGQFGMALARSLAAGGVEVLAVDRDEGRVATIAPHVAEAVALDAMDEAELARCSPAVRDTCICAIGDDAREASIIVTALLKQMGARQLIARAIDPLHGRILKLVGASEVVNPEQAYGERLAARLAHRNVLDVLPLGQGLLVSELRAPEALVGRSLAALQLPRRFGLTVVAVTPAGGVPRAAGPDVVVQSGDVLVVVGAPGATDALLARV